MLLRISRSLFILTISLSFIQLLNSTAQAQEPHGRAKRIAYGAPVLPRESPAIVFIDAAPSPNVFSISTGNLIDERWVLTTRRAVNDYTDPKKDALQLLRGHIYGTKPDVIQTFDVGDIINPKEPFSTVIPHPFVQPIDRDNLFNNDIALLELKGKCSTVPTVPMSFERITDNTINTVNQDPAARFTLTGFGNTETSFNFGLREAFATVQTAEDILNHQFNDSRLFFTELDKQYFLMTGRFDTVSPNACGFQDRGGPLILHEGEDQKIVALIKSPQALIKDCGQPEKLTYNIRLSEFEDFIVSTRGISQTKRWEWRSDLTAKPKGVLRASLDEQEALFSTEIPCRASHDGEKRGGRYDTATNTCVILDSGNAPINHSTFDMVVGTLRYQYLWIEDDSEPDSQVGTLNDDRFSVCADPSVSAVPGCDRYCLALIDEDSSGSGFGYNTTINASVSLPVQQGISQIVRLGILRNNVCIIPTTSGTIAHEGEHLLLKGFIPTEPEEICNSLSTVTPSPSLSSATSSPTDPQPTRSIMTTNSVLPSASPTVPSSAISTAASYGVGVTLALLTLLAL